MRDAGDEHDRRFWNNSLLQLPLRDEPELQSAKGERSIDWTVTGSCGLVELDQGQIGTSFWGKFGAQEFLEPVALGQRQEKIREGVAEGMSDDEFRGGKRMVFGAQPTAKEAPHGAVMEDRQVLE